MGESRCPACGGEAECVEVERVPFRERWIPQFASQCSSCGRFLGQMCACGGQILLSVDAPGQALYRCRACGDLDIAFFSSAGYMLRKDSE